MHSEHYVTLFDSAFFPQGLALHESLTQHASPFVLWVVCMDDEAYETLAALALPTLRPIPLAELETPELTAVRGGRTRVEYCWTVTPFTVAAVFVRAPDAARVTYVDADMFFLKHPRELFREFDESGKAVLITEHAYDPRYDQSATSGIYCVQFMTFVRDRSEPVRRWWADRCVEWCHARFENGKFGDQKYLDDWPQRFGDLVHVLQRCDRLVAPWNACRFPWSGAVAWHFHGLRLLEGGRVLLHQNYEIPLPTHTHVYEPYLESLRRQVAACGRPFVQAALDPWSERLQRRLLGVAGRVARLLKRSPEEEKVVKL